MVELMLTTIAIVEDNNEFRASLARYLDKEPGFRCVCVCSTAEEALQQIPRQPPDVVLMDIHLPKLSGVECTRRLKQLCPRVQILILTVYEDNERISAETGRAGEHFAGDPGSQGGRGADEQPDCAAGGSIVSRRSRESTG